ncbi:phage tail protein [Candidatus Bipolaricaulota bacterium]|nr:phage tail protein [Candidatus Bipolaricaulota bacterium]
MADSTPFAVNPHRFDPYKQYKFRVKWDGRYIAGISEVSGLRRRTEVITHREGGDASIVRKSPGLTTYDPIVLKRGRTHDTAFEQWANKVWNFGAGMGTEVSLKDFRKDIIIELYNEAGQLVMAYKVYRCWPSEYVALSSFNANYTSVAIESLTLQHEGWERDYSIMEPEEPSHSEP